MEDLFSRPAPVTLAARQVSLEYESMRRFFPFRKRKRREETRCLRPTKMRLARTTKQIRESILNPSQHEMRSVCSRITNSGVRSLSMLEKPRKSNCCVARCAPRARANCRAGPEERTIGIETDAAIKAPATPIYAKCARVQLASNSPASRAASWTRGSLPRFVPGCINKSSQSL